MTERIINCNHCGNHLATIRDGKLKKDIVCYCKACDTAREMLIKPRDMPEFFKDIFGKV